MQSLVSDVTLTWLFSLIKGPISTRLCLWACALWADIPGWSCHSTSSSSCWEPFWQQPPLVCNTTVSHRSHVYTHICLLVGLSAGWHKNFWMDFHKTWMEEESRPRMDPMNFWCRSRRFSSLCLRLWERRPLSTPSLKSQGIMHRSQE